MDIIKDRIDLGVCPVCTKATIETKIVEDKKYGKVKICKHHYVKGENKNES